MTLHAFLLLCVLQVCLWTSSECHSCYEGYAKPNGEIHLILKQCTSSPNPTADAAISHATSATSQMDDATVTTSSGMTATLFPTDATSSAPESPSKVTSSAPASPTAVLSTTFSPTTDASSTGKTGNSSTSVTTPPVSPKNRKKRSSQSPKCQIITIHDQTLTFNSNWTATFSCYTTVSKGASDDKTLDIKTCDEAMCNDLKFFDKQKILTVPYNCTNDVKGRDPSTRTTTNFGEFCVRSQADSLYDCCNGNTVKKYCKDANMTNGPCSKDGVCCCPLQEGTCVASPSIHTITPTQQLKKHSSQADKSNLKIIGYISIGFVFGIFIAVIIKFIYGKKKKDQLSLPMYKYSRLRADYVDENQEI